MNEDEQEIFERHYFDCRVCAADVTDGTRMMIAGRVVAAEDARKSNAGPVRAGRFRWVPSAAAASLLFGLLGSGVGYRVALVQQRDHPTELVRVVRIDTGVSRAGTPGDVPTVRAGDELRFDVEPDDNALQYAAVITCGGKLQSRHGISREMAADAISLRLGELPAGRCELVIEGVRKDGNRFEITSSPFNVGER
jgi:hypothetical protein